MIPVARPKEPKRFDAACRAPGLAWLKKNPKEPPKDLWSPFEEDLRTAFHERCGWLAMWIPAGQIDHYLSKHHPNGKRRKKQRPLAYEWSNLRYADGSVNNRKRNADEAVLDPFEVTAGSFEVTASLRLRVAAACPALMRTRAAETLTRLGLDDGRVAMRMRQHFLARYEFAVKHGMSKAAALDQLERDAPLVAAYVRALP